MFCFSCGDKIVVRVPTAEYRNTVPVRITERGTQIPQFHQRVIAGVFSLFAFLTVGGLALLIWKDPPAVNGVIRIEKLTRNIDTKVNSCKNCTSVMIDGYEFPLSTTSPKGLRAYLLQLSKEYGNQPGVVSFFNEEKTGRLFDVSFDISGSVVSLNKRERDRGADELYSDVVMKKVKEYLTKTKPILPGDIVQVHLYGPAQRDNPCNETLTFKYTGQKYDASFSYSTRLDSALIRVGDKIPGTETKQGGVILIEDREKMFDDIQRFYISNLEKENVFCHSNTLLDEHLQRIAPPLDHIAELVERHYVITNDGDFSISGNYITKDDYSVLNIYTDGLQFFNKNRPLCTTKVDTIAFIGMDFQGNYRYRNTLFDFFSRTLSPCGIIFREF
ncbi:MAG: hypothetical protein Q8R36_00610 [bacterium]|nr:hypothetical protein [bacterium]